MSNLKSLDELFAGRHFNRDVIILCVRWYVVGPTRAAGFTRSATVPTFFG
ncbi:hypothetical protein ACFQVB_41155 [Paraburkholderia humisilvae]